VTNTRATIEELLDESFLMWPMSYQGKQAISSSQNCLFYLILINLCMGCLHSDLFDSFFPLSGHFSRRCYQFFQNVREWLMPGQYLD
jgi:hypothetical protein